MRVRSLLRLPARFAGSESDLSDKEYVSVYPSDPCEGQMAPLDTSTYGLLRSEQTSRFTTGYTKTFTYDGAGNLLTLRSSNTIPYNADNQRTGAPQGQPAETYVYDGSGNPTVYRNVNLTYDSGNHLTSYGTTTPILSLYGAEGLRRKKTVGSTSTWYVYDGADPVFELNANGTVKATNVFGANGLASRRVNGSTSFYAFDPMGHAANLVNSAGSVLYNCGYDAYGQPYGNATMLTYGYGAQHGYYRDSEAAYADNLLLCTNRWYDPSTARWLTRDPIGSAGGPNLYGYVGGDPIGGADPSGLRPLTTQDRNRFRTLRTMRSKDKDEHPVPGLVEGAIAALKAEIDAIPSGCADPARLRALWYAIDSSGSDRWDAIPPTTIRLQVSLRAEPCPSATSSWQTATGRLLASVPRECRSSSSRTASGKNLPHTCPSQMIGQTPAQRSRIGRQTLVLAQATL